MMFGVKRWLPGFVVSAIVLLAAPAVFACDLCRDAVATNTGSGSESSNLDFNTSIFFMLGTLFAVMGFIGRVMFKAIKGPPVSRGFPLDRDHFK
jgi:hypothetical protein